MHWQPSLPERYLKASPEELAAGITARREQLGEQLALLLDGASARSRVLDTDTFATAAAIAVVLINNAIP